MDNNNKNADVAIFSYSDMRNAIIKFINDSGINAYDLVRIGKELCCCRTCKFFVQHYAKDGAPVDFGHCVKDNIVKSKRPNTQSCGFWTIDD